jgi:hypothetical protein
MMQYGAQATGAASRPTTQAPAPSPSDLAAVNARLKRENATGWRKRWDSNPRTGCPVAGFQDQFLKPLGHSSIPARGLVLTTGLRAKKAPSADRGRPSLNPPVNTLQFCGSAVQGRSTHISFQDRCLKLLGHSSEARALNALAGRALASKTASPPPCHEELSGFVPTRCAARRPPCRSRLRRHGRSAQTDGNGRQERSRARSRLRNTSASSPSLPMNGADGSDGTAR